MTQSSSAPALPVAGLFTHKTYTMRRATVFAGLAWLTVTTACSGAAGWYILSKDDLAARLITRETTRQYAYEDRITALRADIDRLASRALLDQDGVEARVDELATRQAEVESRQALVTALADTLQTGGITSSIKAPLRPRILKPEEPIRASGITSFAPIMPAKPMPAPDTPSLRGAETGKADINKSDAGKAAPWLSGAGEPEPQPPAQRVAAALTRLDHAITTTAGAQLAALKDMDESLADSQKRMRGALAEIGIDTDRMNPVVPVAGGTGGPFVPFKVDPSKGPFEATLDALQPRIAAVFRLRGLTEQLPLARPMAGDADFTSNYGYRVDPFTRGPAMHTGVDFRAEAGSPIRATAPGKVIVAEYNGGYGNMVEIEHSNGVSTRYAHMSAILASVGQVVTTGTVIGRVGTTGRSTGPHLHYETRINEEPMDPTRFLRAGAKLAGRATL
ncbi:murein DD-endopeptidase MepM/ murein hydrolase activator NlpD [Bosea sp. BE125]|uniref:peptidoglycan DD-metalloendopeptidase family protein n=1 Tax=Bosea sp. BE125 TaxID=2817909 RepID=UPI002860140B|nr:peptidoglycan DD-metalloendopeptidase family protein [Bosea sp. BE125]MDR6871706.1 murein DD-endopeptidase MepM/ murein hydrolase activator NlpD [Bosea sp. BE125]